MSLSAAASLEKKHWVGIEYQVLLKSILLEGRGVENVRITLMTSKMKIYEDD